MKIPDFWQPVKLITPSEIEEFALPATQFNSERAAGMCYEVREVNKCIAAGLHFFPVIIHFEIKYLIDCRFVRNSKDSARGKFAFGAADGRYSKSNWSCF